MLLTKRSHKLRAFLSIFSGMCIHLILGAFYLWGAIVIYVTSYFKELSDQSLTTSLAQSVFPIMGLAINITCPFGIKLSEKLGVRLSIFLLSTGMAACVFVSSFLQNFWATVLPKFFELAKNLISN